MAPDTLQWIKIAVSILMVLALSLVAERVSPRVAGMLAGYPLGNALALFFIGYEIGPMFAAESAIHAQAGFSAALCFTAGYLLGLRLLRGGWGIAAALLLGLAAFFSASGVLQYLPGSSPLLIAVTLTMLVLFVRAYRRLPDAALERRPLTRTALLLRSAAAAALVVAVTAAAHVLPARWAGMLSAFPITMLPFLLIMHATYGAETAVAILKHYPSGLGSLMLYALVVSLAYPVAGLAWGTLAGFAVATVYLYALMRVGRRATSAPARPAPAPRYRR